jgi:hypothetical protein
MPILWAKTVAEIPHAPMAKMNLFVKKELPWARYLPYEKPPEQGTPFVCQKELF